MIHFPSVRITHVSSPPDQLHGERSEKALAPNNDEPKFANPRSRQNLQ